MNRNPAGQGNAPEDDHDGERVGDAFGQDEDEVEEHRDDVDDPATVQFGEGCEEEGTEPETDDKDALCAQPVGVSSLRTGHAKPGEGERRRTMTRFMTSSPMPKYSACSGMPPVMSELAKPAMKQNVVGMMVWTLRGRGDEREAVSQRAGGGGRRRGTASSEVDVPFLPVAPVTRVLRVVDEPGDELGVVDGGSFRLCRRDLLSSSSATCCMGRRYESRLLRCSPRRGWDRLTGFGFAREDETARGLFEVGVGVRTAFGQLREGELVRDVEGTLDKAVRDGAPEGVRVGHG